MSVDQDRQATAASRRATIIQQLEHHLVSSQDDAARVALHKRIVSGKQHLLVSNLDIDGLVSSMMLASVTGWTVGVLVDRSQRLLVHPAHGDLEALLSDPETLIGIDVYSNRFFNVSNHPILFGASERTPGAIRDGLRDFDSGATEQSSHLGTANPSIWAGIASMRGSKHPNGMPYKYPLGTAQLLLALLEAAGHAPRFFDRQYLPWIVANCDGGLTTIRNYAWNVEMWWSCMAAAIGPSSLSESIYRLAVDQRPTEMIDVDRRLRYEDIRSGNLTSQWNLASTEPEAVAAVVDLLSDLSGWPDPFLGGARAVGTWREVKPTRNVLPVKGLTKLEPGYLSAQLDGASRAVHVAVSAFKERGTALGWMLHTTDPHLEEMLGDAPEPDDSDELASVPDADEVE